MPHKTLTPLSRRALALGLGMPVALGAQIALAQDTALADADAELLRQAQSVFTALPPQMPGAENDTPEQIALGERLYYDKDLSANRTQSCATCHPIGARTAGADHRKTGLGALGEVGPRNDPPTLNAGYQIAQFWDGRAATLEEQASGPILNPKEMALKDAAEAEARVNENPDYPPAFKAAFPEADQPVTLDNIARAIAAYERTLITTARFDDYLAGDIDALSPRERQGMQTFMDVGCTTCHTGANLGGTMYQKMGIFRDYPNTEDIGRQEVTGDEADRYVFKVPMLRNVLLTQPYFHDGAVATVGEAVDQMGLLQLDTQLSDQQIADILVFFNSLTDKRFSGDNDTGLMGDEGLGGRPLDEMRLGPKTGDTGGAAPQDKAGADLPAPTRYAEAATVATDARPEPKPGDAADAGADGDWPAPDLATLADQPEAVRYGHALLTTTNAHPATRDFVGNDLACTSCHQDQGTKKFGLPWVGVTQAYPQYRAREDKMGTLAERVNGCFERSMNGKPLPEDGAEMQAILAYMGWLSAGAQKDQPGLGTPDFTPPNRRADLDAGAQVYHHYCAACHGEDGAGYAAASDSGVMAVPPLWGAGSYNDGAGMHRLLTAAAFVHANMPLGVQADNPILTVDEAYDVAAYINSQDRPQMEGLEKDYPQLEKKPVDAPYPPYADDFPQDQHKYGPFQDIEAARQ